MPPRTRPSPFASLAVFLMLLAAGAAAWAVNPDRSLSQLRHTAWTVRDGAPGDVVDITQTPDGFLWLATASGLMRFDGMRFERIDLFPGSPHRPQNLSTLLLRPDGGLWIALRLGGAVLLKDGLLTHFGRDAGLPNGRIVSFGVDHGGSTWASTTDGLYRQEGQRWQPVDPDWGYPNGNSGQLRTDPQGALWAKDDAQTWYVLRPGARRMEPQDKDNQALDMAWLPNGDRWAWHLDGGVRSQAPRSGPGWPVVPPRGSLLADRAGSLWIATWGRGLQRIAAPLAQAATGPRGAVDTFATRDGLSGDLVMSLFEDGEGNLWVGTPNGLDRFSNGRVTPVPYPDGMGGGALVAAGGSAVWAIDHAHQPARLTPTGPPQDIAGSDQKDPRLFVASAYRDPGGTIWAGGWPGLWRSHGERLEGRVAVPAQVALQPVQAMTADSDGTLWVSFLSRGVYRWRQGTWLDPDPRLPREDALSLWTDAGGAVWVGHADNRISRLQGGQWQGFGAEQGLPLGRVTALHGHGPHLWAGGDAGLAVLAGGRFHPVALAGDAPLGLVTGIVETAGGDLWLNEESGIVHLPASEVRQLLADPGHAVHAERIDALDGLYGNLPPLRPTPSAVEAGDGRLWFSRNNAIYWLDPSQHPVPPQPPPLAITAVTAGGHSVAPTNELQLPAGVTSLRIAYTALHLATPERLQFRYRLDGLDTAWQSVGTRREAVYTNLAPGRYRFQVEATLGGGAWSGGGAGTLDIHLQPAWHQTAVVRALLLLPLAGLAWAVHRWRANRECRRMEDRIQARLAERERIARELHDHLMQGTVSLTLQVQAGLDDLPGEHPARRRIETALDRADRVLADTREQVLGLRSHQQDVELGQALADALAQRHADGPLPEIRCTAQGHPRPLRVTTWAEAYRIGLEAAVNALQHARARHIDIGIDYGEPFTLRIRDDGIGLPADVLAGGERPGHWGLRGMHERAALLGATLEVASPGGQGTEVTLRIKAQTAYRSSGRDWRRWREWLSRG